MPRGWRPDNLEERTALSTELLELAEVLGEQELLLAARQWQLISCLEASNIVAVEQNLQAYTRHAKELHQPVYLYWALVFQSTLALLRGQCDQAEL